MRRRPVLVALIALLALPPAAEAKEVSSLVLCGTNGCHGVKGEAAKRDFENAAQTVAPKRAEPFYSVNVNVRADGEEVHGFTVRFLPKAQLIRSSDEIGAPYWTEPAPALLAALREAARGLTPKPTSQLGKLDEAASGGAVDEVFAPAAQAPPRDGGGPPTAWIAGAGALATAIALGLGLAARRRRGGGASPSGASG
jgi:hypothetical protein